MVNSDQIMRKAWNEISNDYQNRYEIGTNKIHYGPLCPSENKLKLLGSVKNKVILELGSGAGQNAIYLSKNGAYVTAIDISEAQIEYGSKLANKEKVYVKFIRNSFLGFSKMQYNNEFDTVISVYALQYLYNVKDQNIVFKAIYRSLKPGGKFIFSVGHPVNSRGHWNDDDKFIIDDYYDHTVKRWAYSFPESKKAPILECNYKTIEDYFISLNKAGFVIEKLLEPKPMKKDDNSFFGIKSHYGTNSKKDKFNYSHSNKIPVTLIIKAAKILR